MRREHGHFPVVCYPSAECVDPEGAEVRLHARARLPGTCAGDSEVMVDVNVGSVPNIARRSGSTGLSS